MTAHDEVDDWGVPVGAYQDPDNLPAQMLSLVRAYVVYRMKPAVVRRYHALRRRNWSPRQLFTLVNALVLVWWVVLYWGERGVFEGAVGKCSWEGWEDWEAGANPHRLIFIADPQLVDPHTYPGRPWPLNPLAMEYTDLYMRRVYSRLQTVLYPDTVMFLGDLFDGGREWSTRTTRSPEKEYRQYGDDYWLKEYNRFGKIFLNHWGDGGMQSRPGQPGRKIISSLPGNHDLGFARGVQVGVRNRFNAYFGDGNRIDILGNHTFVSIDSVSLSALGQDSPNQVEDLWRPTKTFLENAKVQKHRLVQRELRTQMGLKPYPAFPHTVIPAQDLPKATLPHSNADVHDFPTILLSHVPLYRPPGTPCGPLRERHPPSPGNPDTDDRNAIAVRGGYQYQNVLNRELTAEIAQKIGDVRYAFSGDDHDYCELVHRGYASPGTGIREITVKSVSWAMGVRLPGVVLASLWNPVDEQGKSVAADPARKTVQTKLCLLPDQIGTFIRYGVLFGITLVALVCRAALVAGGVLSKAISAPLLPVTARPAQDVDLHTSSSANSSADTAKTILQSRSSRAATFTQQQQQQTHAYTYPLVQHAGYNPALDINIDTNTNTDVDEKHVKIYGHTHAQRDRSRDGHGDGGRESKPVKRRKGAALFWYEVRVGLGTVCLWGFAAYGGLVVWG
ncbi:hypothetical protein P153DRAFT_332833 [Dothidotthia symphoricarpi CBS 119687]|uniref:Uncharacterized protein n=1 Tax=Dothidotthia symphoricarpi CBS 119687 TaxID=1392245 RepID=A0A6A6AMX7_9PLEO|nr:uncharacterized protein P153DRAFT_332833 [Dothidotthia symphoricarpi CBS 119687]KAF2132533.1 hypothetical protein P153DRAFT_332833 [Dothidotthia symphoricarpi CBS 119687]